MCYSCHTECTVPAAASMGVGISAAIANQPRQDNRWHRPLRNALARDWNEGKREQEERETAWDAGTRARSAAGWAQEQRKGQGTVADLGHDHVVVGCEHREVVDLGLSVPHILLLHRPRLVVLLPAPGRRVARVPGHDTRHTVSPAGYIACVSAGCRAYHARPLGWCLATYSWSSRGTPGQSRAS
eukprot:3329834-Rhodomonas_salina.2